VLSHRSGELEILVNNLWINSTRGKPFYEKETLDDPGSGGIVGAVGAKWGRMWDCGCRVWLGVLSAKCRQLIPIRRFVTSLAIGGIWMIREGCRYLQSGTIKLMMEK
jgi:hypothetical protein